MNCLIQLDVRRIAWSLIGRNPKHFLFIVLNCLFLKAHLDSPASCIPTMNSLLLLTQDPIPPLKCLLRNLSWVFHMHSITSSQQLGHVGWSRLVLINDIYGQQCILMYSAYNQLATYSNSTKEQEKQRLILHYFKDKVQLQNQLQPQATNLLNIFLLDVKFDKSTIRLYLLLISSILAKFQEN